MIGKNLKKNKDIYACVTELLCCTPETLQIDNTSIKKREKESVNGSIRSSQTQPS